MNDLVKVAVIVTRFQAGAGGVALRGALALDRERYETTIIAGSGDRLLDRAAAEGLKTMLVPSLVPQISPRDDVQALRALHQILVQQGFNVVHTHSAKAGTLGRLAALWAGVPVIVHTMHGFPFHEFQSRGRRGVYVGIERFLGRRTTSMLAIGSGVAAETIRRGIAHPERVRTVPPAIDPITVTAEPAARRRARRTLGVPPGMSVVGTVGRCDYQKAPEHFVEAIAAMGRADVLGVWIGDGPLRERTEQRAAELGLGNRFLCLGDRDDVASLLPGLDIFAMASRYEGLPCALVEAMTVGIPVVATAVNSVPDVVVPGETGLLVSPQRPDQLARALAHLLEHPADARRMAAAAQLRLGEQFTPAALAAVLEHAYTAPRDGGPRRLGGSTRAVVVRKALVRAAYQQTARLAALRRSA